MCNKCGGSIEKVKPPIEDDKQCPVEDMDAKTAPVHGTLDARAEFYELYNREADEFDKDFMRKYGDDLNTTLVFAGLFSVVTTAFIVDVRSNLRPKYDEVSASLLQVLVKNSIVNPAIPPSGPLEQWNGHDSTITAVQSVLYASLAASFLVSLFAMMGQMWRNRYAQAVLGVSPMQKSHLRQRKMNGLSRWRFDLVMQCLPLVLQTALLLLAFALSVYLWMSDRIVACVVAGFATFGLFSYILIGFVGATSEDCPFQSPLSIALRRFAHPKDNQGGYSPFAFVSGQPLFLRHGASRTLQRRLFSHPLHPVAYDDRKSTRASASINEKHAVVPMFTKLEVDLEGDTLDSQCVGWMLSIAKDPTFAKVIMGVIPEILWHSGTFAPSLLQLYEILTKGCFDYSKGSPVLIQRMRDVAYVTAKAFVYLRTQRQCIAHDRDDDSAVQALRQKHIAFVQKGRFAGDGDLESALWMVDYILGKCEDDLPWPELTFSAENHCWLSSVVLYEAWSQVEQHHNQVDKRLRGFIKASLALQPSAPPSVIVDCLLVIQLVFGTPVHVDDLLLKDNSKLFESTLQRIYSDIGELFKGTPVASSLERAIEALTLSTEWPERPGRSACYELFHTVMLSKVDEEKKWRAAQLTLGGAFRDGRIPEVTDPTDILDFLEHHFKLEAEGRKDLDDYICFAVNSIYPNIQAIDKDRLDLGRVPFVRGFAAAIKKGREFRLRRAVFHSMPIFGAKWFVEGKEVMDEEQRKEFSKDWDEAVDFFQHTDRTKGDTLSVLLEMASTPIWRPHIPPAKWQLLGYYTVLPDDSEPLKKCLANKDLIETLKGVDNRAAIQLWLTIAWVHYADLEDQVKEQVTKATRELVGQNHPKFVAKLRSVLVMEQTRAEGLLSKEFSLWPSHPQAVAVRAKLEKLEVAEREFDEFLVDLTGLRA